MYLLPGQGFEPDPEMLGVKVGPYTMQVTHWIHRGEVTPIARLDVEPQDFPFLERIWGCDLAEFSRRMDAASLAGFPFLKDPQVYPVMPQGGG
jgi:hypothetical protein